MSYLMIMLNFIEFQRERKKEREREREREREIICFYSHKLMNKTWNHTKIPGVFPTPKVLQFTISCK